MVHTEDTLPGENLAAYIFHDPCVGSLSKHRSALPSRNLQLVLTMFIDTRRAQSYHTRLSFHHSMVETVLFINDPVHRTRAPLRATKGGQRLTIHGSVLLPCNLDTSHADKRLRLVLLSLSLYTVYNFAAQRFFPISSHQHTFAGGVKSKRRKRRLDL